MSTNNLLIIDDDEDFGNLLVETAELMGIDCQLSDSVEQFLTLLQPGVELLMIDLIMPGVDGIELLRLLGERQCKAKILLMSGLDKRVLESAKDFAQSLHLEVLACLQKPFRLEALEEILATTFGETQCNVELNAPYASSDTADLPTFSAAELAQGIDNGELVVYYQPKLEIHSRRVAGIEVLTRWQHPELGLVFPDAFIPLAEKSNLIDHIGWFAARQALEDIPKIVHLVQKPPLLALNLSPFSLEDVSYPDKLIEIVTTANFKPEQVILEITESGLFENLSNALDILTHLRIKRFQLSIDDFGTGYAMLQQLQRIPANELKLDKSFVRNMLSQDSARVTVEKMIEMGHALGMKVVAEGVDCEEQLAFLHSLGCDLVQGFYFSRPLPIAQLIDWLLERIDIEGISR